MATKNTNAPTTIKPAAAVAKAPETVQTPVSVKKSHLAQAIFDEAIQQDPIPQRKDIIAKLVAEADLTPAGAATYLQNMKKKAGMVKSTTPTE